MLGYLQLGIHTLFKQFNMIYVDAMIISKHCNTNLSILTCDDVWTTIRLIRE
jgi:hypothetical protein